jgi:hypothetical protein
VSDTKLEAALRSDELTGFVRADLENKFACWKKPIRGETFEWAFSFCAILKTHIRQMSQTVKFRCPICKHRWTEEIEPDEDDVIQIGHPEETCPKCEAQGEVDEE